MRFKKLVSKKQRKLEATDLKLIRAIEDIIKEQNILDKMPIQVQQLIAEREAIRESKDEEIITPAEPEGIIEPEETLAEDVILKSEEPILNPSDMIDIPEELIVNQEEVENNG